MASISPAFYLWGIRHETSLAAGTPTNLHKYRRIDLIVQRLKVSMAADQQTLWALRSQKVIRYRSISHSLTFR